MTEFTKNKKPTYREVYGPAMEITDQADADQYKIKMLDLLNTRLINGKNELGITSEQMLNINLGYYAGYYDKKVAARVHKLFVCSHPIFGSTKDLKHP